MPQIPDVPERGDTNAVVASGRFGDLGFKGLRQGLGCRVLGF